MGKGLIKYKNILRMLFAVRAIIIHCILQYNNCLPVLDSTLTGLIIMKT